jgi:UDP-N-acetylmuramoylalanine--D-glutamate ligase
MSDATLPRALVVGLGLSGVGAAALLVRQGYRVTVNDAASEERLAARLPGLPAGVERVLGGHPESALAGVSLVVVSPGVPWELPLLAAARARGIEVVAEVELAARALGATPVAAVTGSNGKTTTTALVGEMLKAAGMRTGVGGNIGEHSASHLAVAGGWDAVVLELSSFQLEGCTTLRPHAAALLNLSADHLDRHATMATYLALKARIFRAQTAADHAVVNADDPALAALAPRSRVARFSLADARAEAHLANGRLVLDGAPLMERAALPLLGDHNVANALAAALVAARMGAPRDAIAAALAAFRGLPHRHAPVAEAGGVRFVDDSKGTNIGATAAGLAGYPPGSIHLILGGLGKGQDFRELRDAVAGRVATVYLIGAAAGEIAAALAGIVPLEACGTLAEAVRRAAAAARHGDTVLLSPACASFDQFRDYHHRGEEFARLAAEIAGSDERRPASPAARGGRTHASGGRGRGAHGSGRGDGGGRPPEVR